MAPGPSLLLYLGLVSRGDGTTVRWMSIAEGVVGERTAGKSWVLDYGRGVRLQRAAGQPQAVRQPFTWTSGASRDEAMLIAFLALIALVNWPLQMTWTLTKRQ